MEIILKDNTPTLDARLDRVVQFDERSRAFPVRTVAKAPRSYTWGCKQYLDQGREGACVGFSFAHELAARPKVKTVSESLAREIYREAQQLDQWPGHDYEGTSVIAGAKALKARGYIREYRWAFGLSDLISAVGSVGPAVIGVNWYEGMFQPDRNGFIKPTGSLIGGHAILVNSVSLKLKRFKLHNSWGADWGINGGCYLSFDDMNRLLNEDGEACIIVGRN